MTILCSAGSPSPRPIHSQVSNETSYSIKATYSSIKRDLHPTPAPPPRPCQTTHGKHPPPAPGANAHLSFSSSSKQAIHKTLFEPFPPSRAPHAVAASAVHPPCARCAASPPRPHRDRRVYIYGSVHVYVCVCIGTHTRTHRHVCMYMIYLSTCITHTKIYQQRRRRSSPSPPPPPLILNSSLPPPPQERRDMMG